MKCEINKRQARPDKQGKSRKQNKNKKNHKKKYESRIQTGQAASVRGSEGEREGGDTDKARVHVVSKLPLCVAPHFYLPTNCPPRFTSLISQRRGYSNPTTRIYGTLR